MIQTFASTLRINRKWGISQMPSRERRIREIRDIVSSLRFHFRSRRVVVDRQPSPMVVYNGH